MNGRASLERFDQSRASLDRFGGVRDDILQMKNELNVLKKDLSSAKRGLESDKKPLMVSDHSEVTSS